MAQATPINNTLPQHTYGLRSIHRLVDMIHRALARLSYHGMQRPSLPLTSHPPVALTEPAKHNKKTFSNPTGTVGREPTDAVNRVTTDKL